MQDEAKEERIRAVRRFSRFYTRRIGVLHEGLLASPFTLTEGRVIYELAQAQGCTARQLIEDLGLDAGYLSRILKSFEERGLIRRSADASDARLARIALTAAGRDTFAAMNQRSHDEIAAVLARLDEREQQELVGAMAAVERLMTDKGAGAAAVELRQPLPGDIGWVIQAHAELYAREYGWDGTFETMVAGIALRFMENLDPARERCWIAVRDGQRLGSVFLAADGPQAAKLRMLIVTPEARGLGVGRRLVRECIAFARGVGYAELTLWTNDILHAARRIYLEAGFVLLREEAHHSFGKDLVGQYWKLDLATAPPDGAAV